MKRLEASGHPEDLICYSHLRWAFVYQRPQHLMSRVARERRVFFIEEPVREDRVAPGMRIRTCEKSGVKVVTPLLPHDLDAGDAQGTIAKLLHSLFRTHRIEKHIAWYYGACQHL